MNRKQIIQNNASPNPIDKQPNPIGPIRRLLSGLKDTFDNERILTDGTQG